MWELLWLLLPVAAASGWWIGRRQPHSAATSSSRYRPAYLLGLNHLLNEDSDKAIETFVKLLEVDSETVEIHFALGKLYRRRGEVERAIRIHQNLIARPTLSRQERSDALLALAKDYLAAGLFDRAEALLKELSAEKTHSVAALKELLTIYEQEKEWDNAIQTAKRLQSETAESRTQTIAHYYCELAVAARARRDFSVAQKLCRQALSTDPNCARASILLGDMLKETGALKQALKHYRQIEQQDSDYLPLVLEPMHDCYIQMGQQDTWRSYLESLIGRTDSVPVQLAYAKELFDKSEDDSAVQRLLVGLEQSPTLESAVELADLAYLKSNGALQPVLSALTASMHDLLSQKAAYICCNCGFQAKAIHWLCPSCKQWSVVKPATAVVHEISH